MTRISSVVVRRFKLIGSVEIPLDDVTLLIGANNSGKSSVLQAIHFGVSIAQTARLVGEGVAWRQDTFELSYNPSQLLYSPVADVHSLATGGELQEPRPSQIEIEFRGDDGTRSVVGLRRGRNRNIAVSITGRALGEQLMSLPAPFTVYAPGLAGVPKEEKFMSPGVVRRFVARGDANLTLRNVLRMLRQDDAAWDGFVDYMRSIFPGISIEIDFDENTDENIEVFFRPQWTRFPIDAAGTSILQASQIGAYIFLFRPRVLILDEPDSHLHPDNQRTLCELVSRLASERDFQAIISTHSRHVLDCLKDTSRIIWLSKGAIVDQPDINTTEVLLDLGALDSVDYFADGETRCVVATEDTEKDALKAILWSNGFVPDDTEVASYAGSSKADAAIVLGQFLLDKAPHVRLVVHRNRDYMSDAFAEKFITRLTEAHIHPILTTESDIESYFLNAGHISAVNPFLSVERAQELLDAATQEARARSIEAMINLRTEEAFKLRQQGHGPPNHGQIAMTATADYDANPALYRRGKIVVKRLKVLLNQEMNGHGQIFASSPFLIRPELKAIKAAIWPPQA
ncbi:ABC-type cobalamin/Fe3+-siderophores transport system ATPase subunit [Bradyrhizobium sp. I1.8.5]|uniref:AAA family ATPase n=1 Tax=Bradyrhizobium sp. I1.8.5 TaxID=3156365 RepID=UPI0033984C44